MRAVLERDFLFEASRTRSVALRTVFAALVAATICVLLWYGSTFLGNNPDEIGLLIFRGGASAVLALLAVMTPPLVVGSILAERQNETLPLVLTTPVGPTAFSLAKLLSRWGVALTIAMAALPCLALATLFGPVTGTQLLGLVVTALALSLEMAAWSLWISSVSRRLATAAVLSFVLPAARWVGTGFLVMWMARGRPGTGLPEAGWLALGLLDSIPLGPVVEVLMPGTVARFPGRVSPGPGPAPGGLLVTYPWLAYLAFAALCGALAVLAAGRRLRTEAEPRESLLSRTRSGRRWFRKSPPAGNPMAWKETRLLNTAGSRPLFYGVLAVEALTFACCTPALSDSDDLFVVVSCMTALLCLVAAVYGAASFGHEKSGGGYDLLRASLLTPSQVLWGKMAGLALGLGFLAVIPAGCVVLGATMGETTALQAAAALFAIALFPGMWAALGMFSGLRHSPTRAAVVWVTARFGIILVGLPLVGAILDGLRVGPRDLGSVFVMGSPPASMIGFLEWVTRWERNFPFGGFYGGRWSRPDGMATLWTIAVLLVTAYLAVYLPRFLARRMERDREDG